MSYYARHSHFSRNHHHYYTRETAASAQNNNGLMGYVHKYWLIITVPIVYFGTYLSIMYLRGDVVYYHPAYHPYHHHHHHQQQHYQQHPHQPPPPPPAADCDCVEPPNPMPPPPPPPPAVDRRNAHERLMDEVNERNKRFLSPNRQPVETEIIAIPENGDVEGQRDDLDDEGLIVVGTRVSESQWLVQKYKKDPEDKLKEKSRKMVQIPRRNVTTASCLVWTLTQERVLCTKWK